MGGGAGHSQHRHGDRGRARDPPGLGWADGVNENPMTRSGYIKSNSVRLVSIYRHTPPVFRPQKLTVPHTVHNTATSPGRFGSTATCEQRKKHSVMGSVYPPGSHEAAVLASSNQ